MGLVWVFLSFLLGKIGPTKLHFFQKQKKHSSHQKRSARKIGRQAEQQDFECFFERYLRLLRSQPPDYGLPAASAPRQRDLAGQLTGAQRMAAALPRVFDVRLRRNVEVVAPVGRGIDYLDDVLFKGALQHYEDFRQILGCIEYL